MPKKMAAVWRLRRKRRQRLPDGLWKTKGRGAVGRGGCLALSTYCRIMRGEPLSSTRLKERRPSTRERVEHVIGEKEAGYADDWTAHRQ